MYMYRIVRTLITSLFLAVLFFGTAHAIDISTPALNSTVYQGTSALASWTGDESNVSQWTMRLTGGSLGSNFLYLRTVSPLEKAKSVKWTVPSAYSGSGYKLCFEYNGICAALSKAFNIQKKGEAQNLPPNLDPIADVQITLPNTTATLSANATDPEDRGTPSFVWSYVSGPSSTIKTPNNYKTDVVVTSAGTYVYKMVVTDVDGQISTTNATLVVNPAVTPSNNPPQASIIPPISQTVTVGSTITITGDDYDSDGTIRSRQWARVAGAANATIVSPTAKSTQVTGLTVGQYTFRYTVTDDDNASGYAETIITINPKANNAPVISQITATPSTSIQLPTNAVTLMANVTDADPGDTLSYVWTKTKGGAATFSSTDRVATNVSGMVADDYEFQVVVSDGKGGIATKVIGIAVTVRPNDSPTVQPIAAQSIQLPTNSFTFTAVASDDKAGLKYQWIQSNPVSPVATIAQSASSPSATITVPSAGVYTFTVQVTDSDGASFSTNAVLNVIAANSAPVVTVTTTPASPITLPTNSVVMNATATDADGIATYAWSKVSGGAATISGGTTKTATVTGLVEGAYVFAVTVTDTKNLPTTVQVPFQVNRAANVAPTVTITPASQTITLPISEATFTAVAADTNGGTIASYAWVRTSGPNTPSFTAPTAAATKVTGLIAGDYVFTVTVKDNEGAPATAQVAVKVLPSTNAYTQIVAFGDSLSDMGNYLTYPPANTQYTSYPAQTWVKQLAGADLLDITPFDPSGNGTTAVGTNYAFGGAMTKYAVDQGFGYGTNFNARNLTDQITTRYGGTFNTTGVKNDTKTIHTVEIGGNDIVSAANQTAQIASGWATLNTHATQVAKSAESQVDVLAAKGAKKIMWMSMFDISSVPLARETAATLEAATPGSGAKYIAAMKNASNAYNDEMDLALVRLKTKYPSVSFIKFDTQSLFATVMANAAAYNFTNTTDRADQATPSSKYLDKYLFSDNLHPTYHGHNVIAQYAYNYLGLTDGVDTLPLVTIDPVSATPIATDVVTLTAHAADPAGSIQSYAWTKISGPNAIFSATNTAEIDVTGLTEGTYVFQVKVTDNSGKSTIAQVTVRIAAKSDLWDGVPIPFELTADAKTSAGIYKSDGTLVRTLWSNVEYEKGEHTEYWDGTGDDGDMLPDGEYSAKVLSNNVEYVWEGVVGNTSKAKSGTNVFIGRYIDSIVIVNGVAYIAKGQSEGTPSHEKFLTSDPNGSKRIITVGTSALDTSLEAEFAATDGERVYWGGTDAWASGYANPKTLRSLVFATTIPQSFTDNDPEYIFQGQRQSATVGLNTPISLSVTKTGGTGLTYVWTKTSAPGATTVVINSPAAASTNISGLTREGQYVFTVAVTDSTGYVTHGVATITVVPGGPSSVSIPTLVANSTIQKLGLGYVYGSAISIVTDAPTEAAKAAQLTKMSGLAVQKNGQYLFVSYAKRGEVRIYNKITGVLINTIKTFTMPRALTVDNNDNLLITSGTKNASTIQKFTVSSAGVLSAPTMTISGLSDPLGMAVSPDVNTSQPDEKTLIVADAGDSQQLKAFNVDTGASLWVYGVAKGYATDPTVADNKFFFSNDRISYNTFVAFDPKDGTFWVGDSGNGRSLHFNLDRTLKEQIMQTGIVYSLTVDQANPKRLFEDFLEFEIDYSKPLEKSDTQSYGGSNGSWKFVKNWGYNVPSNYISNYDTLRSLVTVTRNGRTVTYSTLYDTTKKTREIVELPATGQLRFTGIGIGDGQLYGDGSIRETSRASSGAPQVITSKALVSIDANNNPSFGAATVLAQTPPTTNLDPIYFGNRLKLNTGEVTSSNLVVMSNMEVSPKAFGQNYHLGAVRAGDNKWLWKTAPGTYPEYTGAFPTDGSFDEGNRVEYAGVRAMASGKNIFWGYHGEFWKNSQTNMWTHVYDNGLMIGQFGVIGPDRSRDSIESYSYPGMAGNVFSPFVTIGTDGKTYLYHNDEGHHAGAHRWRVDGLDTIKEKNITVNLATTAQGLRAQYYKSTNLNSTTLDIERIDPTVNAALGSGAIAGTSITNAANASYRWDGFVAGVGSGEYQFYTDTQKGVRLWVDGSLVIDEWDNATQKEFSTAGGTPSGTGPTIVATGTGTKPPTIYANSISPGRIGAFIKWYTNEPKNSQSTLGQVEYGLTTAYGSITPLPEKTSITSEIWINGLKPGTTYHYRLVSTNPTTGDKSTSIDRTFRTLPFTFGATDRLPIMLEVKGGGNVKLMWSGPGIAKQVIPTTQLYPGATIVKLNGYDLMEGLAFNQEMGAGEYGWAANPVAVGSAIANNNVWSVKQGSKTYNKKGSTDIFVKFAHPTGKANTVTRDLGTQDVVSSWNMTGRITFEADYGNTIQTPGTGGSYLEVLDDQGRAITRIYILLDSTRNYKSVTANGSEIVKLNNEEMRLLTSRLQSFAMTATNGKVTTSFADYAPVTTGLMDTLANWKKPKTLRMYFWQVDGANTLGRSMGIDDVHFLPN